MSKEVTPNSEQLNKLSPKVQEMYREINENNNQPRKVYPDYEPLFEEVIDDPEERARLISEDIIGIKHNQYDRPGNMDRSYAAPDAWKRLLGEDYRF